MADLSRTDALNRQFGISGVAQVVSGDDGLPKLEVSTKSASAEIYLHGAQVTSWQPAGAEEVIFLSRALVLGGRPRDSRRDSGLLPLVSGQSGRP